MFLFSNTLSSFTIVGGEAGINDGAVGDDGGKVGKAGGGEEERLHKSRVGDGRGIVGGTRGLR